MHWSEFEHAQPRLAALGRRQLIEPGVLLVATIRRDGAPRVSAVEPLIMDGRLLLSMLWQSAKAADLLRDPRILVHGVITSKDGSNGEFKLRGLAREAAEPEMQRRYAALAASTLGWEPVPGRFHLFEVDLAGVAFVSYDKATGDQHTAVWPPGREFVRRATSATSLGAPEPASELIAAR